MFEPPRLMDLGGTFYLGLHEHDFTRPLADAQALLDSYDVISQAGQRPKPALARSAIVMTMSGWQAFIERLTEALLVSLEPYKSPTAAADEEASFRRDLRYWQLRRGEVLKGVADFSTPNSDNCRNLLLRVGFDPWPVWTVTDGRSHLSPAETRARLDDWLRLRHALAHGNPLQQLAVLDRSKAGSPMVTRRTAERCHRFVRTLINVTDRYFHPKSLLGGRY